jgi:hypothetical protein
MGDKWMKTLIPSALVLTCVLNLTMIGLQCAGRPVPPAIPPAPPPEPEPPTPPAPKPDPVAAIVRISRPGVGCSAAIIGPRRVDGRWDIVTAAHCTERIGERWTMRFRDGRTGGFTIVNRDTRSDCAWGVSDANDQVYPFTFLAEKTPPVGTRIWHAGFGVNIPGNREDGQITGGPTDDDKIPMMLDVSSGDSGGGIMVTEDGTVFSVVCCARVGSGIRPTWGATTEAIHRAKRELHDFDQWTPIPLPERMPPKP